MLIVLIFMLIFVLFNGCAIQNILLLTKLSKNMTAYDLLYHQAKSMLYRTEEVVSENIPDCLIAVTAPEKMIKEPLNWWKSNGCSGSFSTFKYYYVIEQLGIDPCAVIDPVNKTVADWFRITLNFFAKKGDARIFLQSTFTRPATTIEQCASLQYHAQTGRQSLRELNY